GRKDLHIHLLAHLDGEVLPGEDDEADDDDDDADVPDGDRTKIRVVVLGGRRPVMVVVSHRMRLDVGFAHRFSSFIVSARRGSPTGNSVPLVAARAMTISATPTGPSRARMSTRLGVALCSPADGMTSQ